MFEKTMVRGLLAGALVATMLSRTAMADVIPPDLPAGSQYLIMFVTADSTQATSSDIETYDNFVQTEASLSPTLPNATWSAVATTPSFPADQASTTTTIPVYDTQGN